MKEGDIWCSMRQDSWSGYCKSHDVTGDAGVEVLLSSSMFANTLSTVLDPEDAEDSGN